MPVFIGLIFVFTPTGLYIVWLGNRAVLFAVGGVTICLHFSMEAHSIPLTGAWLQTIQQLLNRAPQWRVLCKHYSLIKEKSDSYIYVTESRESALWPPSSILGWDHSPFSFSLTRFDLSHSETLTHSARTMSRGCSDGLIDSQVHFTLTHQLRLLMRGMQHTPFSGIFRFVLKSQRRSGRHGVKIMLWYFNVSKSWNLKSVS